MRNWTKLACLAHGHRRARDTDVVDGIYRSMCRHCGIALLREGRSGQWYAIETGPRTLSSGQWRYSAIAFGALTAAILLGVLLTPHAQTKASQPQKGALAQWMAQHAAGKHAR